MQLVIVSVYVNVDFVERWSSVCSLRDKQESSRILVQGHVEADLGAASNVNYVVSSIYCWAGVHPVGGREERMAVH